jgi:hypothetical protein
MRQSRSNLAVCLAIVAIGYLGVGLASPSASATEENKSAPALAAPKAAHPEVAPDHAPMAGHAAGRERLARDRHIFHHHNFVRSGAQRRRL